MNVGKTARAYFGFSRMSHAVLDIGFPALGSLFVLGAFPPYATILLGVAAASAGYIAVFALNDLMDLRVDTERMERHERAPADFDIDVLGMRHPVARKALTFRHGAAWVGCWGALSLSLAYVLNPICVLILIAAVVLEMGYCRLLEVTHWKTLLSGSMVGVGALAGPFAVVGNPPWTFLLLLFVWAFAWEVGARNIPNDRADFDEDIHLGVRTFPVRYGRSASSRISLSLLCLTVLISLSIPLSVEVPEVMVYEVGALVAGAFFLILPGWRLVRDESTGAALALFNRACFYPLAMLLVAGLTVLVGR